MNEFDSSVSSLQSSPSHAEISRRAQELWARHGQPVGRDEEIWLEAERSLAVHSRPSASTPASGATPAPARRGSAAMPRLPVASRAGKPNR